MAEERRTPDPEPDDQDVEVNQSPTETPPSKIPDKTLDDILEEDRFQSTDN